MTLCVLLVGPPSRIKLPARLSWWFPFICFLIPTIITIIIISSGYAYELSELIFYSYLCGLAYSIPIMTRLIYYDISRRREYLADACSALYTRYPEGLASALEKIAASTDQVLAASPVTAPIYIVNPFRKKGMVASDVAETHPPISERISILRSMARISYADYDRAYRKIRGTDKNVLPNYATSVPHTTPIRSPLPDDLDHIQRARETSNLLWNLNNYRTINCPCGTRMRLPPSFKLPEVKCPHCGRINPV
jgi:heat shock protein HtpX